VLAVCDQVFGHRLMMDRIVPGGVATDISAQDAEAIIATLDDITPRFAEIVRLYDETPSLQDRTCTTGTVSNDLVTLWAAGGYVGRASGRSFDPMPASVWRSRCSSAAMSMQEFGSGSAKWRPASHC
jgi:Ni,Fe-hydrogenase III large subunit